MRNVVICVSLNQDCLELLNELEGSPLLSDSHVHFVHCFKTEVYTSEFSAYVYPTDDHFSEIQTSVEQILSNLRDRILPNDFSKDLITYECAIDHSPKKVIREYLYKVNANLVVVATRGKHGIEGLFSSSFTEHLLKFSPCPIYVLRPHEK